LFGEAAFFVAYRYIPGNNLKQKIMKKLFVVLAMAGVMTACNSNKEKKADGMNDKMEEKRDGKMEEKMDGKMEKKMEEVKDTMAKKMDQTKPKM